MNHIVTVNPDPAYFYSAEAGDSFTLRYVSRADGVEVVINFNDEPTMAAVCEAMRYALHYPLR